MKKYIYILLLSTLFVSCSWFSWKKEAPVDLDKHTAKNVIEVPYEEKNGNKVIKVEVNGVPMKMIFDTGCSGMHMSLLEVQNLYKQGAIRSEDFEGESYSFIANGSIVENLVFNLKEIEIGGETGIVLHDVETTVSKNLDAPVLLGNGVIDQLASVEVDNIDGVIRFKKH